MGCGWLVGDGGGGGAAATATHSLTPSHPRCPLPSKQQGGGNPFGNMGNLMENLKKAQQMVQVEAAKVQEELAV